MRIMYAHPVHEDRGRHRCVAMLDVEFHDSIRLYGLRLLRMEDGNYRVFAPLIGKRRAATFSTDVAAQLTGMALDKLGHFDAAA